MIHRQEPSQHAPRARARTIGESSAAVTVVGCVGYPLHHVEIGWPWSPFDRRATAELDWLIQRTGATRRNVVGALVELGHLEDAA